MCTTAIQKLTHFFRRRVLLVFVVAFIGSVGCASTVSPFSHIAYEMAVDLKVDTLEMMDLAELQYSEHSKQVQRLSTRLNKAYEFANGRPKNDLSARQWEIMISPDHFILGGFLHRWETEGSLSRGFIAEAKAIVSDAFDSIISLESGKLGSTKEQ